MTRRRLVACVVLLLASLVFFKALQADFIFLDDSLHVYRNPGVVDPSVDGVVGFWKKPYVGLYMPVTLSLWTAQSLIAKHFGTVSPSGNPDARFLHGTNVAMHALNAILFFFLCEWPSLGFFASLFAAAFFLLHPLHVESVAWVSGFKDLISGFFGLAALLVFLGRKEEDARTIGMRVFALALFALSLLSKPSMVVLPLVAASLAIGFRKRSVRSTFFELAPWILAAVPIVILTPGLQHGSDELHAIGILSRLKLVGPVLGFYLGKALLPTAPLLDYSFLPRDVSASVAILGWAAFTCVGIWAFLAGRRAVALLVWFFALLIPVSGIIAFDYGSFSLVADRYTYLSVGALAVLFARCFDRDTIVRVAGGLALLVAFAYTSFSYTSRWSDTASIFSYTAEKNPKSRLAYYNLAIYYAWKKQPSLAEAYFEGAIAQGTSWPDLHFHYASLLADTQRFDAATTHWARGLKLLGKTTPELQCQFADLLVRAGKKVEAQREAKRAGDLDPSRSCSVVL